MGKLRIEPIKKRMEPETYQHYLSILKEAQDQAVDSHLFYDLDENEKPNIVKKDMLVVAEKAGIPLKIRLLRADKSLRLTFGAAPQASPRRPRLTADETREMILTYLRNANEPVKRKEIIDATGISLSSWNLQIRELLRKELVKRTGSKSETTYVAN